MEGVPQPMVINHLQVLGARPPSTDWKPMAVARKWEFPTIDHHVAGRRKHRSVFVEKYHMIIDVELEIESGSSVKGSRLFSKVSMYEVNLLHLFLGWNGFKRMFICCKFWESRQRQQQ